MNAKDWALAGALMLACGCSSANGSGDDSSSDGGKKVDAGGTSHHDSGGGDDVGGGDDDATTPDAGESPDAEPSPDGSVASEAGGSGSGKNAFGGCGDDKLLPVPADPSARGPWDVGVRTVTIGRLTVEILYPAKAGSTAGVPVATYDVRDWLPADQKAKVPDANVPQITAIGGHVYRDVAIDDLHGPYPAVIAIHGTASFRIASGSAYAQWASRGFVVAAADYPGLGLKDQLCATGDCQFGVSNPPASKSCANPPSQDIPGDVTTQIKALTSPDGTLAFLAGHADMSRIGITGHSQGACVSAGLSTDPNVQIVIPMAGSLNVAPSPTLKSLMFIAGVDDKVIGYSNGQIGNVVCSPATGQTGASDDKDAYLASPGAPVVKRLVGIKGGGHLVVTDLCQTNSLGKNAIQEAEADKVCGIDSAVIIGLPFLFDCGTVSLADGFKAVSYASTAALEETLHCQDRSEAFANMTTAVPQISDFQHVP